MKTKIVSLLFALVLLSSLSNASALTQDDNSPTLMIGVTDNQDTSQILPNQINDLTRKIILKIIELEKFNLHYRQEVGKQGRWAGWRYAGLQEINSCLNLSAAIYSTGERTSHFKHPDKLSRPKLEQCNVLSMIGYIIGASAGALEFGITEYHDLQASKKGFSPQAAKSHVLSLKRDINNLLMARETLLKIEAAAPLLLNDTREDLAESKVLADLRDLALLEFEKFHIDDRRFVAFQKSLYLMDMTKFTCGAIGSFCAYMSQHRRDRRYNLAAGILYGVAGSLVIATPFASRGIGIIAQKIQKCYIAPITEDVKTKQITTLDADENNLERIAHENNKLSDPNTQYVDSHLKRIATYREENQHFQSEFERIVMKERAGKLTATQTMIAGSVVGSCNLAGGILYTSAGSIASGKTFHDSSVTNYNLGSAAIIGISASSISVLDTLRIQVKAEIERHKAAKAGRLSSQIYATNLSKLEKIEDLIRSGEQ
jgi:hypothetical protein